ncbi:MAG: hypothetical protein GEV08_02545 [Acidimicrobiia bacterium]|nr:hypothetical protein [Acidimicrobiia bacterium]
MTTTLQAPAWLLPMPLMTVRDSFGGPSEGPRPGRFDPRGHQELYDSLRDGNFARLRELADDERTNIRYLACALYALKSYARGDLAAAEEYLITALEGGDNLQDHPFVCTRMAPGKLAPFAVPLALDIVVYGHPLDHVTLSLLLAELLQDGGAAEEAAGVLAALPASDAVCLASAELAAEEGDAERALALAGGASGRDELSAGLLVFEGWALRRTGEPDEARQVLVSAKAAAPRRSYVGSVAEYELALCEWLLGKTHHAQRRLEKLLKSDRGFRPAQDALECVRLGWLPLHEI